MFVTRRPTLTLALLLTVAWWPVSLAARCLYYGDVSLTGRLIQQTYPGPPDFESVTKGDQPLVIQRTRNPTRPRQRSIRAGR
jgi:hypothetical protein